MAEGDAPMSNPENQVPPTPQGTPAPQPPEPIPYASAGGQQMEMNPEARTMGMLCHLLSLTGYLTAVGFVVGPLIIWLMKKDTMPFVDDQGKESLNFQITVFIATAIGTALACFVVGIFLLPVIAVFHLIFAIVAGISASQGNYYRYPVCLRLIK
jgi:uncharacterized Tic20 family protein